MCMLGLWALWGMMDNVKCLNCYGTEFEIKDHRFKPEIHGRKVNVVVPAKVCSHCNTPLMDDEQMEYLMKVTLEKSGADK